MSVRKNGNPTEDRAAAPAEESVKIEENGESLSLAPSRLVSNIKGLGVILVAFSLVASTCKHLAVSIETGYPLYLASYSYQDIFPSIPGALIALVAALACLYCIFPALAIINNESPNSRSSSDEKNENKTRAHKQDAQVLQRIATSIGLVLGVLCGLMAAYCLCSWGLMWIYDRVKYTLSEIFSCYVDVTFVILTFLFSILIFIPLCWAARHILYSLERKGQTPTGENGSKWFSIPIIIKNAIKIISTLCRLLSYLIAGLFSGLSCAILIFLIVMGQLLFNSLDVPGVGTAILIGVLVFFAVVAILLFSRFIERGPLVKRARKTGGMMIDASIVIIFLFSSALFGVLCSSPSPMALNGHYYYVENAKERDAAGSQVAIEPDVGSGLASSKEAVSNSKHAYLILDTFANGKAVVSSGGTYRLVSLEDGEILISEGSGDEMSDNADSNV